MHTQQLTPLFIPAPPPRRPLPRGVPPVLGRYRLTRPLGRGGMGTVYEARDVVDGRRVAIKFIPYRRTGGRPAPVLGEAALARRVRHPNVVAVHDADTYPDGAYLVMELVDGRSVQALLDDGPLPWREATTILLAACAGLRAVHGCGVVHRDLKPANLLRAADGTVKLTDFGLARPLERGPGRAADPPRAGTPHYMSPEQCRGEAADERADLYALGATYYALLTGRPPYPAGSPAQVMFAHCGAPVPDPRTARRDVPAACAAVVRRCMAKRPADRFGSAGEVRDALRAVFAAVA